MIYICSSFSLAMLPHWRLVDAAADGEWPPESAQTSILVESMSNPREWLADAEIRHGAAVSAVGDDDTAALFGDVLGRDVPVNVIPVSLGDNDDLLVGMKIEEAWFPGCEAKPWPWAPLCWFMVCIA